MSEEIEIPIPPRFCGSDLSFLSMSEQIIPPIIARMNSVGITSSNRLSCLEMLGMVLIQKVGLDLNAIIKHEYAA